MQLNLEIHEIVIEFHFFLQLSSYMTNGFGCNNQDTFFIERIHARNIISQLFLTIYFVE